MDARAINAQMVAKLLATSGEPVPEGGYALRVIETRGRDSGAARRVPLAVVQREDRWYLVSPDRSRDWVRNLLETPACAVVEESTRLERHAEPADAIRAAAVVAQYLRSMTVPWAIEAFAVAQDATEEQIAPHLPGMAVFELREPA
ncbi:nitroreductase/quinone reductase family protein [Amycolatopsis sp. Hca4]|uniref:nitroreductase/quinone reductase family protein n=1 Tax=Amycolatopsis sp. Hca4 TaxID=2742131 RepID=UPI001591E816|nr:nitroreductase/quinone reductase family protein [Amycolatopsis sp. Hca4]QKV73897.1 nitroreductase family deazaflavin-dependent oxidoreductase [Amycolatopsis sp. Hca4]